MTGFPLDHVRKAYIMTVAVLAFCTGNIILVTMSIDQLYWTQAFWAVLVMPFGMDLSFPATTIIMSNQVLRERQGIAVTIVAAIVDYSISICLGISGIAEAYTADGDVLRGYRGAWYSAIGLSGCGVIIAIIYSIRLKSS